MSYAKGNFNLFGNFVNNPEQLLREDFLFVNVKLDIKLLYFRGINFDLLLYKAVDVGAIHFYYENVFGLGQIVDPHF